MKLYQGNAKELVGKKIDCRVRRFGYYPMEVIERDGKLYIRDAVGVCMPIPEREDDFNCHEFDVVMEDCFISNNEPYPLCKGNGSEKCHDCCQYEDYENFHSPY